MKLSLPDELSVHDSGILFLEFLRQSPVEPLSSISDAACQKQDEPDRCQPRWMWRLHVVEICTGTASRFTTTLGNPVSESGWMELVLTAHSLTSPSARSPSSLAVQRPFSVRRPVTSRAGVTSKA